MASRFLMAVGLLILMVVVASMLALVLQSSGGLDSGLLTIEATTQPPTAPIGWAGAALSSRHGNARELERMVEAAEVGDTSAVQTLLRRYPEFLNAMHPARRSLGLPATALQAAAANGRSGVVALLLETGADPNVTGGMQFTALHDAALGLHPSCVAELLKCGAATDVVTSSGNTALHLAVAGADLSDLAPEDVVIARSMACSSLLLAASADPNVVNAKGATPLAIATSAERRNLRALAEYLVRSGADESIEDAARLGHEARLVELMKYKPESFSGAKGVELLDAAAQKAATTCIAILVSKGVEVDGIAKNGLTPLQHMILRGQTASVRALLELGANPNNPFRTGHSLHRRPPMYFVDDQPEIARLLVSYGAEYGLYHAALVGDASRVGDDLARDVKLVSAQFGGWRRTLLHAAAVSGSTEVVALLLSSGANVNALDGAERTPLHLAALHGQGDVARLLFSFGADTVQKDYDGRTALDLAAWAGHDEIARYLRAYRD